MLRNFCVRLCGACCLVVFMAGVASAGGYLPVKENKCENAEVTVTCYDCAKGIKYEGNHGIKKNLYSEDHLCLHRDGARQKCTMFGIRKEDVGVHVQVDWGDSSLNLDKWLFYDGRTTCPGFM